jgi:SAM-dependent methyltransferase
MTQRAERDEKRLLLAHMTLLAGSPERIVALRLAMSSAIGPSSVVLDAGCGPMGLLAIMAARLGARRVVAVDRDQLEVARALAAENGVADQIEFLQCDLADLPAGIGNFDVILGMVYDNEPRRDLAQQRLIGALATGSAHPGTVFIPGTVRYTVAGYDSAHPDPTARTRQDDWESAAGRAEAYAGITMAAVRRFPIADHSAPAGGPSPLYDMLAGRSAAASRRGMTLITSRELFAEINYADPATAAAYPPAVTLTVTAPGQLDTTIWRQDLKAGDLLIRSTTTTHPLAPPRDVQPGDTAILSTDGGWGDAIPLHIRPGGRA